MESNVEFFVVAAHVIPAIILALAYEGRVLAKASYFDREMRYLNVAVNLTILITMAVLIVGEYCAFRVLFNGGNYTAWDLLLVRYALFWGGGIVLAPFVQKQLGFLIQGLKDSVSYTLFAVFIVVGFAYSVLQVVDRV